MKYSGIDLYSNNSVVTVTDEEDRVVAEKRLPNDLTKIVGLLMPWRARAFAPASSRQALTDLPLPSTSGYHQSNMSNQCRHSHRGLSPHYIAPMLGAHNALNLAPLVAGRCAIKPRSAG